LLVVYARWYGPTPIPSMTMTVPPSPDKPCPRGFKQGNNAPIAKGRTHCGDATRKKKYHWSKNKHETL